MHQSCRLALGGDSMETIRDLLKAKGHKVWTVSPDDSVLDAIRMMAEENIGALVVVHDNKIVGIVTERHYARNVVLKGKSSPGTPISEIMEDRVICAQPDQKITECMAVMTESRVRHLPVVDQQGALIGMVSIGDLVKTIINDQEFMIDQLTHYIYG